MRPQKPNLDCERCLTRVDTKKSPIQHRYGLKVPGTGARGLCTAMINRDTSLVGSHGEHVERAARRSVTS